jgi:hypothetical protein
LNKCEQKEQIVSVLTVKLQGKKDAGKPTGKIGKNLRQFWHPIYLQTAIEEGANEVEENVLLGAKIIKDILEGRNKC